jgi:hypothetical protein
MRTAAAILLAFAALAGCGKSKEEKRVEQQDRVARTVGWHAAFDFPPQAVAAINAAGFGLKQPAASPYRETGRTRPSSGANGASARMEIEIVGHTPSSIDTITYRLVLDSASDPVQARDQFAKVIGQFLDRFAIANTGPLFASIRGSRSAATGAGSRTSASLNVDGAPASVTAAAGRLDVTFTRPAPKAGSASIQG